MSVANSGFMDKTASIGNISLCALRNDEFDIPFRSLGTFSGLRPFTMPSFSLPDVDLSCVRVGGMSVLNRRLGTRCAQSWIEEGNAPGVEITRVAATPHME